mmetsp:Transcript_84707/g.181509  ORF Transcript_84707/g.181509 Transcript_84707/m.181509 type:complete len:124 (-) Transcript_84707:360-731(-)
MQRQQQRQQLEAVQEASHLAFSLLRPRLLLDFVHPAAMLPDPESAPSMIRPCRYRTCSRLGQELVQHHMWIPATCPSSPQLMLAHEIKQYVQTRIGASSLYASYMTADSQVKHWRSFGSYSCI